LSEQADLDTGQKLPAGWNSDDAIRDELEACSALSHFFQGYGSDSRTRDIEKALLSILSRNEKPHKTIILTSWQRFEEESRGCADRMGREGYVSESRGMPQLRYAVEKISRTRGQTYVLDLVFVRRKV
jgi:hypothetical protein